MDILWMSIYFYLKLWAVIFITEIFLDLYILWISKGNRFETNILSNIKLLVF